MGRKKEITSRKSQKEIDDLYLQTYEAVKRAIEGINIKLGEKRGLSDEEFRFLKKSKDLIDSFIVREKEKEGEEDTLPEGRLKQFIENVWRQEKVLRLASYPKGKEGMNKLYEEAGYYRCKVDGELHKVGEECPFLLLEKSVKEKDIEDHNIE